MGKAGNRENIKKRIFDIIQIGNKSDIPSTAFDIFIVIAILLNLTITFMMTFDELSSFMGIFKVIEFITILIFTVEYILRIWTADYLYPDRGNLKSILTFLISFNGIIDFLTIFPYYIPATTPVGIVAFRVFRVIRIFRLFRVNSQYDAFNVILEVFEEKKNQIISSLSMILILTIASSLLMYSVEHEAQPEVFKNAFSGIWWSVSTLLTVGYGDIYPITLLGRSLAIVISFLGVGMVAVPTGIISAGFVEKYTAVRDNTLLGRKRNIGFIVSKLEHGHSFCGKKISEIILPPHSLIVLIKRGREEIVPKGDTVLIAEDSLIIASLKADDSTELSLEEVSIETGHPWVNKEINALDISRQQIIVSIGRAGKVIIPKGSTIIRKGDSVLMYTRKR